jgi:exodeoxyribonuclease-3
VKLVTYNVNGIKARLPRLIEYLAEQQPDIVCLQELKASDETFPEAEIRAAGYGAVWHGQKGFNGVAVLARGVDPVERQRGLAGDPEDAHSRYLEVDVDGLTVASIYLPNGNPQPGPKFDYKLKWIERLSDRARALLAEERPAVLAGDYQAGAWQRDAGFRIDHMLLSPQAADRLVDAGVDKEYRGRDKASDHAPTWVRLR